MARHNIFFWLSRKCFIADFNRKLLHLTIIDPTLCSNERFVFQYQEQLAQHHLYFLWMEQTSFIYQLFFSAEMVSLFSLSNSKKKYFIAPEKVGREGCKHINVVCFTTEALTKHDCTALQKLSLDFFFNNFWNLRHVCLERINKYARLMWGTSDQDLVAEIIV